MSTDCLVKPKNTPARTPAARREDTPRVARRRKREARTVSQMVCLYCRHHHKGEKSFTAHCGEAVCADCHAMDAYAVARTMGCRKMEVKTSCEKCPFHCYRKAEREAIRRVMRYAGPRMLLRHPIAAIRHVLGK